ncbi:MAG: hypothetical protein Q8K00_13485 [Syntrophales bacterium]|nr:hypothetical protein [Syntrophales bacterium]
MNIFFAVISIVGTAVAIMLVSTLGLGGWLNAVIITPLVLFAVYSMARIQPRETLSEKIPGKSVLQ